MTPRDALDELLARDAEASALAAEAEEVRAALAEARQRASHERSVLAAAGRRRLLRVLSRRRPAADGLAGAQDRLDAAEREAGDLAARLVALGAAADRAGTSAQREAELVAVLDRLAPRSAPELRRALDERAAALRQVAQRDRQLSLAGAALRALDELERELLGARGWSRFDVLGGGLLATAGKLTRLGDARAAAAAAEHALRDLDVAIGGLPLGAGAAEGLGSRSGVVVTAADVALDGPLVDLLVHGRIRDALRRAADTRRAVDAAAGDLRAQRAEAVERARAALLRAGALARSAARA